MDIKKNTSKKIKVYVGFGIVSKYDGHGKCVKIDYTSHDHRYLFKFENDAIKWMSDEDVANVLAGREYEVKVPEA